MNSSKIMLLILASFGYKNLQASETFTKSTFGKEIFISNSITIFKESALIDGLCFDSSKEDEADLKEFSSKFVLDYKLCAKDCARKYYFSLGRIVSLDQIDDIKKQFVAFRAAKSAE